MSNAFLDFRPSLKELFLDAQRMARKFPSACRLFPEKQDVCFFCGKKEDYIFGFVTFIPVYFGENYGIRYVCNSHKGEWWNCQTGEMVINPGKSGLLSFYHQIVLVLVILIRFIGFFLYGVFMWYLAIYPYYWYRQLKNERR